MKGVTNPFFSRIWIGKVLTKYQKVRRAWNSFSQSSIATGRGKETTNQRRLNNNVWSYHLSSLELLTMVNKYFQRCHYQEHGILLFVC